MIKVLHVFLQTAVELSDSAEVHSASLFNVDVADMHASLHTPSY